MQRLNKAVAAAAWVCAATAALSAAAQLEIQIESEGLRQVPIAIARFEGEPSGSDRISQVIADDLRRSGRFRSELGAPAAGYVVLGNPEHTAALRQNLEYVVAGRVDSAPDGRKVTFQLFDALTGKAYESYSLQVSDSQMRLAGHIISNWLIEEILQIEGPFTSKIAYVLKTGPQDQATYELKVADYDGYGAQTIVKSREPIISPEWTPDGDHLLYVSFEQQRPVIYEFDLLRADWRPVAAFPGNNSAPAISPDGRWIAVALSEEGTTKVFLLTTDGTRRRRLRETDAINTEPDFAPDSSSVVYVGDEIGNPQLYLKHIESGEERRLTYGSRYNVSPAYAPNGKLVAFIRRDTIGFNVHVLDPASDQGRSVPLTAIRLADAPSFSPDGSMVLFKDEDSKNRLYTVSVAGKILFPLPRPEQGEIINPTWGPSRSSWF